MRHAEPSLGFLALLALVPLVPLAALQQVPSRPKLTAEADTNHAGAYYAHGLRVLSNRPDEAADAFYWAARLDPGWAQPLYARRIALLMEQPRFLVQYMTTSNRRFYESKDVLAIDSLELRARMLNPYLTRDLDREFIVAYLTASFRDGYRRGDITGSQIQLMVERYLCCESTAWTKAWLAASERRFGEALELYRQALEQNEDYAAEIHEERARAFFSIGNDDSARVEMELALEDLRKQDADEFVRVYSSKAVLEHSLAMIYERRRDFAAAREAYGRALEEDLAYYPAHARLGLLARAAGDTTTALSELALAVELAGNEPSLRLIYGAVLADVGRTDEAAEQLLKAVELEPLYATPYYVLGRVAESAGKPGEAVAHYQAFIERAQGRDRNLADARAHLSALSAAAGKP